MAQDYAEECVFGHNRHRSNRSLPFPYVGENIAITNNPLTNPRDLVHGWYNESQYYDAVAKECVGKECRHYTQVGTMLAECPNIQFKLPVSMTELMEGAVYSL